MNETVLITGISGFIAKHVALDLLKAGYTVRGTVRREAKAEAVRETLAKAGAPTDKLSFVVADLGAPEGWDEAVEGADYIQHIASPFPLQQPRDREALVPAARDGAVRVFELGLGAGAKRIVVTSSMVAMTYWANRPSPVTIEENSWTDPDWSALSAYIVSKTRAEKALWERAETLDAENRLAVVNPGFVLGPTLDATLGTSIEVIKLFMTGAYPAVPKVHYPVVDVRDLAQIHVRAMESEDCGGRRLMATGETLSMLEMAKTLRAACPDFAKKIPTRELPNFMVKLVSNFDRSLKAVIPDLGVVPNPKNSYVTDLTGVTFRPSREAVADAGTSLIEVGAL